MLFVKGKFMWGLSAVVLCVHVIANPARAAPKSSGDSGSVYAHCCRTVRALY